MLIHVGNGSIGAVFRETLMKKDQLTMSSFFGRDKERRDSLGALEGRDDG